ncbi:MAG: hypothetical protein R3C14_50515 [Caldilineaceae bacterium]
MSSTAYKGWVALIIATAIVLRLWGLGYLPPGFHFDEAFEGLEAWRIFTDSAYRPIFLTGNFGVPPLNAYANALTFALVTHLGGVVGPVAMRATAATIGMLSIGAMVGLARELRYWTTPHLTLSPAFPLWAAAGLAVMRWHIHFSRMGIEPIFVPLIWITATGCLLHGWRTGRWLSFVGSGLMLALAMYAYQGAWIIPLLMVLTVLWLLMLGHNRPKAASDKVSDGPLTPYPIASLRRSLLGAGVAAVVALLLVLPLGWFFWQNSNLLLLRPTQLSIVGPTTSPADTSLFNSVWATAKMFGPWGLPGDLDPRRNVPGLPALSVWLALPFYGGLVLALWRVRAPAYAIMLTGLIGLLLPGVFSEYAPHFHRILGASAPVALLCGVGLDALWQWRPVRAKMVNRALQGGVLLLLVGGGITEAHTYFVQWANLPDLFYAFDVGLWQLGEEIAAQPSTMPLYLTPRAADHATLAFAWTTRPGAHPPPVAFDGRAIFPLTAAANPQAERYAVIEHEDFRTRLLLPEVFPTATIVTEIQDGQGAPYAHLYERPPDTTNQRPPQHPLTARLGDGIALAGYDVQPATLRPGEILYLQLHWDVTAVPTADWTVFTHLLAQDGQGTPTLVAGQDSQPGAGSLPTTRWQAGWRVLDEYQIVLPADLPAGVYGLAIGLYQPNGEHLPVQDGGLMLGQVQIE